MSRQMLWLAGAALLFAGAAQADSTKAQAAQERSTIVQKAAPASSSGSGAVESSGTTAAKVAEQELHPDAKPVYLDGGHYGGSDC